jgi:hypothetical protein
MLLALISGMPFASVMGGWPFADEARSGILLVDWNVRIQNATSDAYQLTQVCELLLPGDSPEPIPVISS